MMRDCRAVAECLPHGVRMRPRPGSSKNAGMMWSGICSLKSCSFRGSGDVPRYEKGAERSSRPG